MSALLDLVESMIGQGIRFSVDEHYLLNIAGNDDFLSIVDLSPLKQNRALIINSIPKGYSATAYQLYDALEAYEERVCIMVGAGGLSVEQAELQSLYLIRRVLHRRIFTP